MIDENKEIIGAFELTSFSTVNRSNNQYADNLAKKSLITGIIYFIFIVM